MSSAPYISQHIYICLHFFNSSIVEEEEEKEEAEEEEVAGMRSDKI